MQLIGHDLDFILNERAEDIFRAMIGMELDDGTVGDGVGTESISKAHGEVVLGADGDVVLEIEVGGVAGFAVGAWDVAFGAIVVELKLDIAGLFKILRPAR